MTGGNFGGHGYCQTLSYKKKKTLSNKTLKNDLRR
jgi:hypothetical protein